MSQQVVLENSQGQVLRCMPWKDGDTIHVVRRLDNLRVELLASLDQIESDNIPFEVIREIKATDLTETGIDLGSANRIRKVQQIETTYKNEAAPEDNRRLWLVSLVFVSLTSLSLISLVLSSPPVETASMEEELKEHVVKVVQRRPPKEVVVQPNRFSVQQPRESVAKVQPQKTGPSVKRMGALGVLGSLSKSKQQGGVDLGAVNTTAGPGLGGTGGSGGVQTSLYGKGLVAAPVGPGSNMQGGGGYGTKGRGGGQAGYGKLSLIGSAGNSPIPLGKEAIIEGGLDPDLIAAVIERNKGQITFCYEQGLQSQPNLTGRVAVNFVIGGNGQVSTADIGSTTLHSKIVEDCILMRLKAWKFPLPEGGVSVKVSYPFLLQRRG